MRFTKTALLFLCIVLSISLVFLVGCDKTDNPIKIGVAGTMSGKNSDLSVSGRRGIELAVDEFNKAGGYRGRKIELVVKDDKNNAETALEIDKEFVNEKIPVVIGHYTSGMIVNSMHYLADKDILFLSPTISADSLKGIDDNFIRFIATTNEQAVALTDLADVNNDRKFAVVYDLENKGFNEAFYKNFKRLLEEKHGQIIYSETFSSNAKIEYGNLAMDIAESNADAVLIIADSANNAAITQQIRRAGCEIKIYSPLWSNTADLVRKCGTAIEGMYIVGAIDLNDSNDKFVRFKKAYGDKYGEEPTFSSVYSYEAAKALFQAIKKGPDITPSVIKKNILNIQEFEGLEGKYKIDSYGDNIREYMMFRFENGHQRKVGN